LIHGALDARAGTAVVDLTIEGPGGERKVTQAVVDTGFTGSLAVPEETAGSLQLTPLGEQRATLADGRLVRLRTYEASVMWDGQRRNLRVIETSGATLVGMALLRGYDLRMQVIPGGDVTFTALT
jgi:clan AA aspartic protease